MSDTLRDALARECDRVVRRLMRHRERYLRAWVAATGVHPTEALVEEHHLPGGVKQVVCRRRLDQTDLVDRLAKLLKEREWWTDREGWDNCLACNAESGYGRNKKHRHKPDCELVAALKAAGIECEVEAT